MSDLPTFLTPYSHWILAHRNTVIVVLALVLFAVACHSLIARWRVEGLERALAQSRNAARSSTKRTYSPGQEEQVEEASSLPPVRGGRSYARNLGTALQKAGGPQIYSPPTPAGWTPNVTPGPQPPSPWGSPPPAAGPWQFIPAGQGSRPGGQMPPVGPNPRYPGPAPAPGAAPGMPPVAPGHYAIGPGAGPQAPFYAGPPTAPPAPGPVQPGFTGAPGTAGAPPQSPPGFPAFPGSSPAAPPMAPGGGPPPAPFAQPVPPGVPAPMGMAPFPGEATGETAGRGKSKRRRFNLSVLENIEKMVQSAAAGVANQASAMTAPQSAPVAPTATPGPFTAPAGDRVSAPSAFGPFGAPAASIPAPSISSPATPPQEPTLPLDSTPASRTVAEPPADEVASSAPSDGAVQPESASVPESQETENETALAQEPDQRSSMRSMMFGEEHPAPRPSRYGRRFQLKPEPKPVVEEPEPGVVEAEPVTAGSEPTGEEPEPPVGQFEEAATAELAVEEPTLYQPSLEETPAELGDHEESPSAAAESMETIAEPDQAIEVSTGSWEADQSTFSSTADEATMDEPASSISQVGAEEAAVSPEPVIDESEPFSFSSGFGETAGTSSVADSVTPPAEETPQGSGPTMVIIEDDESVAQYYATLFRGNGYRVEVANDGVSGVDLCSKVQPAVILLDVMMPRQNGILVLQTLRASDETRETPVVVLSNFSEPTLIKRALQLGALEYVIKTQVEGAALLAAVPRWLNREKAFAA